METRKNFIEIFDMDEADIEIERKKVVKSLVKQVSNPKHSLAVMLAELEVLEIMGFVATMKRYMEKQIEDLPGFHEEFMVDLNAWVIAKAWDFEKGMSDQPYSFDHFKKSIRYYANRALGLEKDTVIGLIKYLIYEDRMTEFCTMSEDARMQMYIYALIELRLQVIGVE